MSGDICQYFLRNSCRYGSKCRNRHVYEQPRASFNQPTGVSVLQRNKYVVNNQPSREEQDQTRCFQDIYKDFNEYRNVWPLSSYCPVQTYGPLQGFDDISPEEMMLEGYEARVNGTIQHFMATANDMRMKVAELKKSYLNREPKARQVLTDYLRNGPSRARQFSQGFRSEHSASNCSSGFFSQAVQKSPSPSGVFSTAIPSPVANNTSAFNLSTNPAFGEQQPSPVFNQNIFAQALSEELNTSNNTFHQPSMQQSFGQKTSVFGEVIDDSLFKQNLFGDALKDKPSQDSVIAAAQASQSSSQFNFHSEDSKPIVKATGHCYVYSTQSDLTQEELEQFMATTFTYGKIPLNPPPKELC